MKTEELFKQWWGESYPASRPATHTVTTHVAFAEYFMQHQTQTLLEQVRGTTGGNT